MARRRRGKRGRLAPLAVVCGAIGLGIVFRDSLTPLFSGRTANDFDVVPTLTTDRPENDALDGGPHADVPERGENPAAFTENNDTQRSSALLESARRGLTEGDPVLARAHFSEALGRGLSAQAEMEARTELRKLGRETIFSSAVAKDDPYASYYTIAPGDSLNKIARRFDVTAEFLALINGIRDPHRIQAGRRIKVVQGPFHVRVTKSTHTLDVFCVNTFVEHFKVGLGAEDSTPNGTWVVKSKLKNPTYFPPRGGNIVAADDPANPLGERWIGLEGIDGDAVGQARYGIHGTVDPDSIGKNASMGCIRLHNDDVARLFDLLVAKKSSVEIVE